MEADAEAAAVWRVFEGLYFSYLFGDACKHLLVVPVVSFGASFLDAQAGLPVPRTHRENILGLRNRGRRALRLGFAALGILQTSATRFVPVGRRQCP